MGGHGEESFVLSFCRYVVTGCLTGPAASCQGIARRAVRSAHHLYDINDLNDKRHRTIALEEMVAWM